MRHLLFLGISRTFLRLAKGGIILVIMIILCSLSAYAADPAKWHPLSQGKVGGGSYESYVWGKGPNYSSTTPSNPQKNPPVDVLVVNTQAIAGKMKADEIAQKYAKEGVRVVFWNPGEKDGVKDGAKELVEIVKSIHEREKADIRSLALLDHQNQDSLVIGNEKIDKMKLEAWRQGSQNPFKELNEYMLDGGQLQIWGCRLTSTRDGKGGEARELLSQIDEWMNCSVHASDNDLEFGSGSDYQLEWKKSPSIWSKADGWFRLQCIDTDLEFSTRPKVKPVVPFGKAHDLIQNGATESDAKNKKVKKEQEAIDKYEQTMKSKNKYAATMEKIQTYEQNMSNGGRALPAETAQDACVATQNLLNRLDKGIKQDDQDGRINIGNTLPITDVTAIQMKWRSEMDQIVENSGRDVSWKRKQRDIIHNGGDGAANLDSAVRRYIKEKKEKDRKGSDDCWALDNALEKYNRELDRLRQYCPSIQVPNYMASKMKKCEPLPKPQPQGDPCAGCSPCRCPGPGQYGGWIVVKDSMGREALRSPDGSSEIRSDSIGAGCCKCAR